MCSKENEIPDILFPCYRDIIVIDTGAICLLIFLFSYSLQYIMRPIFKTIGWLTIFSIAMGFLETAVVIYLRKLYYPGGFDFPLIPIPADMALVEFLREAATIIMLAGLGILAGKSPLQRFAFFLFCFAVWDIFYYVFLKIFLNWPSSWFTWDILFLIPVPWVGPVIAPVVLSLTMIAFALVIIYFKDKEFSFRMKRVEWFLVIAGCLVVITSFIWDYIKYASRSEYKFWTLNSREDLFREIGNYIPQKYNWPLFWLGEVLIILAIGLLVRRLRK